MANRYWVGSTDNWDGTAGTKWATTSGGAGGAAVPTASDDVFFDAASGANTITISATSVCKSITCTGFTGTLAGSSQLTVSGNVTFVAGMTLTYTGTMIVNATSTLTSGGLSFTGSLSFSTTATTKTLADNWTVLGTFTSVTNTQTVNGNTLYLSSHFTVTGAIGGTTLLVLNGTGTWSGAGNMNSSLTINTAGTITFSTTNVLTSGSLIHVAGTVVTAGNTLTINGPATLNTNGVTTASPSTTSSTGINFNNITFSGINTVTLSSNLCIVGNLATGNPTFSGTYGIYVSGSLTNNGGNIANSPNTTIYLIGTGTLGSTFAAYTLNIPIVINTSGTITLNTYLSKGTNDFTYIAGAVVTTGSELRITGVATYDVGGITFNNVVIGTSTLTLTSNLNIGGNATIGTVANQIIVSNGSNINCSGNVDFTLTTGTYTGTSNINLIGSGNFTGAFTTGYINNNITFNTAGTITLVGTINYRTGTMTYTAGTINGGTSTLGIQASCTLNTSGINWYNITVTNTLTITNNSLLTVLETLTYASGSVVTFAGTHGWTVGHFVIATSGAISHILVAGVTYTILDSITSVSTTNSLKDTLASSSGVTKAILTLNFGATQNVAYTNATRIDSSGGQTIYSFNGTLTDSINWQVLNASLIGSGVSTFVN